VHLTINLSCAHFQFSMSNNNSQAGMLLSLHLENHNAWDLDLLNNAATINSPAE
jgi:hypothetical protein